MECTKCNKTFNKTSYDYHVAHAVCSKVKPNYQCQDSKKTLKCKTSYNYHIANAVCHKDRSKKCSSCMKRFKNKSDLAYHIRKGVCTRRLKEGGRCLYCWRKEDDIWHLRRCDMNDSKDMMNKRRLDYLLPYFDLYAGRPWKDNVVYWYEECKECNSLRNDVKHVIDCLGGREGMDYWDVTKLLYEGYQE